MRKNFVVLLTAFSLSVSTLATEPSANQLPPEMSLRRILCAVSLVGAFAYFGVTAPEALNRKLHEESVAEAKANLTPNFIKKLLEVDDFSSHGRVARVNGKTYIINSTLIFEIQPDGTAKLYRDSDLSLRVTKIASYRGEQLIALGSDGKIRKCSLAERQTTWTVLETHVAEMVGTTTDLYALTNDGRLTRYEGKLGDIISGETPTNLRTPSFKVLDRGVKRLSVGPEGKTYTVSFEDGRIETR